MSTHTESPVCSFNVRGHGASAVTCERRAVFAVSLGLHGVALDAVPRCREHAGMLAAYPLIAAGDSVTLVLLADET